jgi:hypothetical protein
MAQCVVIGCAVAVLQSSPQKGTPHDERCGLDRNEAFQRMLKRTLCTIGLTTTKPARGGDDQAQAARESRSFLVQRFAGLKKIRLLRISVTQVTLG